MAIDLRQLPTILGINSRNLNYIHPENPRTAFPLVDDKTRTKEILCRNSIPVPQTIAVVENFAGIDRTIQECLSEKPFVIKPARGRAGGGVLLAESDGNDGWRTPSGRILSERDIHRHIADILFGVYSFGRTGDRALIETRIEPHPFFRSLYPSGIPDIRVITYRCRPAMAMLRIPTDRSDGKANLHQGAIGVGINMDTGITGHASQRGRAIRFHPDSHSELGGLEIPFWQEILGYSRNASKTVPLGYLGIDFVVDRDSGPMILELNARPGLQIQVVNRKGLATVLKGFAT